MKAVSLAGVQRYVSDNLKEKLLMCRNKTKKRAENEDSNVRNKHDIKRVEPECTETKKKEKKLRWQSDKARVHGIQIPFVKTRVAF